MAKEAGLVRALHLEILRPIAFVNGDEDAPASWEEVGPTLDALRSFSHRLTNAATLGAILVHRANKKFKKGDPRYQHPRSATYQAIPPELEDCHQWARTKLESVQAGQNKRVALREKKQAALDKLKPSSSKRRETLVEEIAELDKTIKEVGWTIRRRTTQVNLELPSAIQCAISNQGYTNFKRWEKDPWTRIPSAKRGAPIPIQAADCALLVLGDRLYLDAKITPVGRVRFLVMPGRGAQWAVARSIAAGEIKHGALKLVYSESKKKWFVKIAYSVPLPSAPPSCDPNQILLIHRGWDNFLYLISTTGQQVAISGKKLLAQKAKIRARRTDTKRIGRHERGTGAKGHGRKRYYDLPNRLEDLEANMVKTTCQQNGARVAQLAVQWGCLRVFIEAYGGMPESDVRYVRREVPHPPYHQQKMAIAHALAKVGLKLEEYDCYYVCQTCPRCGSRDPRHAMRRHGMFRCIDCEYERDLDFVSAYHALCAVNGGPGEVWETRHAEGKRVRQMMLGENCDDRKKPRKATRSAAQENASPKERRGRRSNTVPAVPG